MMGVFAECERSIIQERVRAGLWSQTTFRKPIRPSSLTALSKMSPGLVHELAQLGLLDKRDDRFGFRDLASARQIAKLLNDGFQRPDIGRRTGAADRAPWHHRSFG